MSGKKKGGSKKIRVAFKNNRNARTREIDWTRRYEESRAAQRALDAEESLEELDENAENNEDENDRPRRRDARKVYARRAPDALDVSDVVLSERVSAKGDAARKRTVVGSYVGDENLSGEVGDFVVLPDVDLTVCQKGRVLSSHGLVSYVEDERGRVFTCSTRRVLKTLSTEQRQIVVAGDRVYFRDVDDVLCALHVREVFIDLEDDVVGDVHDGSRRSASEREIEISVRVHLRYLHHRYVDGSVALTVVRRQVPVDHRHEVAQALVAQLPLIAGHVPRIVVEVFSRRVALYCFERMENEISSDLDIEKFFFPLCQRAVQEFRDTETDYVVYPVPALYDLDSFFRCL